MMIQDYINSLQLTQQHASLAQLREIQEKHLELYSFSSISALGAEIISLQEEALLERLVHRKKGGYCFEQNKLAYLALEYLGYEVQPLLAKVLLNGQEDNARTHRITLVKLEGESYLFDVGFGSKSPKAPLCVSQSGTIAVGNYQYKVTRTESDVRIELFQPEQVCLYSVSLTPVTEKDFDVVHFYSHQHPESNFVNNLVLSRVVSGQRFTLRNLVYRELHEASQFSTVVEVTSAQQLLSLIRQKFLLNVCTSEAERLFSRAQKSMRLQSA
ncbi:arylamine N-acetyltransferase [Pseudoalteromonas rubra]|uniref:Arylamine N-acetyltransferase n=1 Tax=Pseudoalteromonas rubra TaxID=43658 RepID=A0A4Q7EA46_9GAMM|nr:arylamine N-acetyltransferase [Pseudoalteromonas rubra]RZM80126.1 arylamine N-acetyltransferase [Pseudoalteromonas rubra]